MATLAGGTVDREWQRLQLSQQDVLDLKRALVEDEDPTGLMADLGVKHFHKPFFRIRIPVGGSDVSHTRDAATCEDAFPSIAEFAQKRSCPARAEVLALSRSQHQPLLGNLRCISLGDMRLLERFLDPENCGTPRNLKHDGGGSGAGGGSGGGGRGPAESAASLLEELGLSVYDRPYCEIGPELGLDNTDFDLDSTLSGDLCSVIDFARQHNTPSLKSLIKASHKGPAFEPAGVFTESAICNRSLCELILSSTLREDLRTNKLVVAGWLQSAEWKACRALARRHNVIVIDAEHGAITLDQIALCIEVMAANGCLGIVRVPFDLDRRKAFARRCLDAGAIGILFPNVQSAEEARELIQNCYYPRNESLEGASEAMSGTRGFGYGGCNEDGAKFREYVAVANEKVVIGVQLENRVAFSDEVLDGILSTKGLCFTQDGPYDHSGSYGVPGETSDPRVLRDLALYRKKCGEHAVTAGKHVVVATVDTVREAVEAGYSFIALGTELLHIMNGADSVVATAQRTLGSTPLEDGQSPGGF